MMLELKLYKWYTVKVGYDYQFGQCIGLTNNWAVFRYNYFVGFYSSTRVSSDHISEEINDPRYLVRFAKLFATVFLDLKFHDVRFH